MSLPEPRMYPHYDGADTLPVRILRSIGSREEGILGRELRAHFTGRQKNQFSPFYRGLRVLKSRGHIRREEDSSGKWWLITQEGEEYLVNVDNLPIVDRISKEDKGERKKNPPPKLPPRRSCPLPVDASDLTADGGTLLRLETDEDWITFLSKLLPRGGFNGKRCSMLQLATLVREKGEQCGYDVSLLVSLNPQATILALGWAVGRVAPLIKKRGLAVCQGIGLGLEIGLMAM